MPFTFLSHQAPVLPFVIGWPKRTSGLLLCVGSMAPDLAYFFLPSPTPTLGHSLPGLLLFCLPLSLVLGAVIRRIAPTLCAHLPDLGPLHLRSYASLGNARARAADGNGTWLDIGCALFGSVTHVGLDSFTHRDGWATLHWSLLRATAFTWHGRAIPVCRVLQHAGSVVLAILALAMLVVIGRQRARAEALLPEAERPVLPATDPARFYGLSIAVALVGGVLRISHDGMMGHRALAIAVGHALMQAGCFLFIGFVLATAWLERRARRETSESRG